MSSIGWGTTSFPAKARYVLSFLPAIERWGVELSFLRRLNESKLASISQQLFQNDISGGLKKRTSPMQKLFSLEGQTVLITGGTRGIGQAAAIALAEAGADVLLIQVRFLPQLILSSYLRQKLK